MGKPKPKVYEQRLSLILPKPYGLMGLLKASTAKPSRVYWIFRYLIGELNPKGFKSTGEPSPHLNRRFTGRFGRVQRLNRRFTGFIGDFIEGLNLKV